MRLKPLIQVWWERCVLALIWCNVNTKENFFSHRQLNLWAHLTHPLFHISLHFLQNLKSELGKGQKKLEPSSSSNLAIRLHFSFKEQGNGGKPESFLPLVFTDLWAERRLENMRWLIHQLCQPLRAGLAAFEMWLGFCSLYIKCQIDAF